jgi:hypothetical protein
MLEISRNGMMGLPEYDPQVKKLSSISVQWSNIIKVGLDIFYQRT